LVKRSRVQKVVSFVFTALQLPTNWQYGFIGIDNLVRIGPIWNGDPMDPAKETRRHAWSFRSCDQARRRDPFRRIDQARVKGSNRISKHSVGLEKYPQSILVLRTKISLRPRPYVTCEFCCFSHNTLQYQIHHHHARMSTAHGSIFYVSTRSHIASSRASSSLILLCSLALWTSRTSDPASNWMASLASVQKL